MNKATSDFCLWWNKQGGSEDELRSYKNEIGLP